MIRQKKKNKKKQKNKQKHVNQGWGRGLFSLYIYIETFKIFLSETTEPISI